jgi:hypothetical protein
MAPDGVGRGLQQGGGFADPVGQGRAVKIEPRLCGNWPLWYAFTDRRRVRMAGFIEGIDRGQTVLFPERFEVPLDL